MPLRDIDDVDRLKKINAALVSRVERSMDQQGNAFSLFQTAISLENRVRIRTDRVKELAAALVSTGLVDGVTLDGDSLFVDTSDVGAFGRAIAPAARDVRARLLELVPLDDDLESVFRYLVGRS